VFTQPTIGNYTRIEAEMSGPSSPVGRWSGLEIFLIAYKAGMDVSGSLGGIIVALSAYNGRWRDFGVFEAWPREGGLNRGIGEICWPTHNAA
jgi:hypothetical protein